MTATTWTKTRLRKFMTERGLTQSKLAEALGVTRGCVQNWIKGRRAISALACRALDTLQMEIVK